MDKNHHFLTNLRHGKKKMSIFEGPEKNFLGPKKFMGVFYIAKLEFWLQK